MRMGPLLLLVLIVAVAGSAIGSAFVWVIAVVSLLALGVLFFFMVRQGQFVGPRILIDDAKERIDDMGRDDEDAAVVVVRQEDKSDV